MKTYMYAVAKKVVLGKIDVLKYIPINNRDSIIEPILIPKETDYIQYIETSCRIKKGKGKTFPKTKKVYEDIIPVGRKITRKMVEKDKNWKYQPKEYEEYLVFIKTPNKMIFPIKSYEKEGKDYIII